MPPRELLHRMSERFRLLDWRTRRAAGDLRGAFDWSWNLLGAAEKAAFAQLSVFEGGFDLAAAEAVIDLGGRGRRPWTVDVVQSLVQKSLLRQLGDRRFGLLAAAQEYAAEQLRSEGRFAGSGPGAMHAAQAATGATTQPGRRDRAPTMAPTSTTWSARAARPPRPAGRRSARW